MIRHVYYCLLLLVLCTPQAHSFGMAQVKRFVQSQTTSLIARAGCKIAGQCGKEFVTFAWCRFKEMRGINIDTIEQSSRLTATSSRQLWPSYITKPPLIAPPTVPPLISGRIDLFNTGNYAWPTCKPILLVGPPGTGKTELAKYTAHEADLCHIAEPSSSIYGSRKNLATELIYSLFKRARYRSLATSLYNVFKNVISKISFRGPYLRKPSVIHMDEFNGLALATSPAQEGKQLNDCDNERALAFNRLIWELNRNPHMPENKRDWAQDLPQEHIMRDLLQIEPHLSTVIPNYSCPPAMYGEKFLTNGLYKAMVGMWLYESFRYNQIPMTRKKIARLVTDDTIIPLIWAYQHSKKCTKRWCMRYILQVHRLNKWLSVQDDTDTLLIATTNLQSSQLDHRVSRLFDIVEVPHPNATAREHILRFHAQGKPCDAGIDLTAWAQRLDGFSPDRIAHVVRRAAYHAIAQNRKNISYDDFQYAYNSLRD